MRTNGITNVAPSNGAPPWTGQEGDTYWNTATKTLYVYNGTAWQAVGGGGGWPSRGPYPGQVLTDYQGANPGWYHPSAIAEPRFQTSHGFTVGQWVRYDGTNFVLAQANSETNAEVVGMVGLVIDANQFVLIGQGASNWCNQNLSGLTPGAVYFLSPTTAGTMTTTEPTTPGQVSKPVMQAITAAGGWILNMRGNVIPSPASTIQIFANAGARDIAIPSPVDGQTCYLSDTGRLQVYRTATPVGWYPPWNTAWGCMAQTVLTGPNQTGIGTVQVDLTGLTVTFTGIEGRRYRISSHVRFVASTAPCRPQMFITLPDNTIIGDWIDQIASNVQYSMGNAYTLSTFVGATTLKLRAVTNAGLFETTLGVAAPAFLLAEDIGPVIGAT